MQMLYVFDLDDTLIEGYMSREDRVYHWVTPLPGRKRCLNRLRNEGHHVAVATNQAGPAFGYISPREVWSKLAWVSLVFNIPPIYFAACIGHPNAPNPHNREGAHRRKPSGLMTTELCLVTNTAQKDTIFIGDREEDALEAQAAGVGFVHTDDFFSRGGRER